MNDYLLLMHDDAPEPLADSPAAWEQYLDRLRSTGLFSGGSAIGKGLCLRKSGPVPEPTAHLTGYLRVQAASLQQATALLTGNPVFEAGGTVEIRELPRS